MKCRIEVRVQFTVEARDESTVRTLAAERAGRIDGTLGYLLNTEDHSVSPPELVEVIDATTE